MSRFTDSWRWPTADEAIITACLLWATFEIVFAGARPSALAFITTIITLVIGVKADSIRRANNVASGKPEAA